VTVPGRRILFAFPISEAVAEFNPAQHHKDFSVLAARARCYNARVLTAFIAASYRLFFDLDHPNICD
jgi:hypothetical protein